MKSDYMYARSDFASWSKELKNDHPEIAEALQHIADGMSYDDVIRIDALGEILVTTMVHGEEVD